MYVVLTKFGLSKIYRAVVMGVKNSYKLLRLKCALLSKSGPISSAFNPSFNGAGATVKKY